MTTFYTVLIMSGINITAIVSEFCHQLNIIHGFQKSSILMRPWGDNFSFNL